MAVAEENADGPEKGSALAEGHEVLKNDGVVVTAQVMLPVPTKQMSEKSRGVEEGVFVCLGQAVLTRQIDESVVWSKTEGVEKVEEWEASELALVMTVTLRLTSAVEVVVAVMMAAVAVVVEMLEAVAVVGKAVMVELEALKEEGRTSSEKVVVGIFDTEVNGEDAGVVLLGGAEVVSHMTKAVEVVGDCQTVEVEVEGWTTVGEGEAVWRTGVVEAGVLRAEEVGARDLRGAQAVRLSKSSMTSLKRTFH